MEKKIKEIEKILKYNFKKTTLLETALTHKSFDNNVNNEKLEFLGDRVIGLIISKKLITLYPNENEGLIDKKFASLVNKKTCAKVFRSLNLKKYIKTGNSFKNIRSGDERILSDTCEALIGAVYLDQGFTSAEKFVLNIWKHFIKDSHIIELDPKTKIQEYSLKKFKKLPIYKTLKKTGPNHNPFFQVSIQIENSKKYLGEGNSKKTAEQNAALKLIKNLNI